MSRYFRSILTLSPPVTLCHTSQDPPKVRHTSRTLPPIFSRPCTRVTSIRVLGVVLSANLTMGNHLDEILSSSASSIHALRMLRSHGLGSPQLHVIARSTTLASVLYASPAWWGFTSARDKDRLEKLIGRLQRGGFLPDDGLSFAGLAADADRRLFRSLVSNPSHVLSRHLPAIKTTNYNLRPRAHGFTLPEKDTCNFIPRMLFERIYC